MCRISNNASKLFKEIVIEYNKIEKHIILNQNISSN